MTKIGRNDLCPCGSGKKYKKCCLKKDRKNKNKKTNPSQMNDLISNNPSMQRLKKDIKVKNGLKEMLDLGILDNMVDIDKDKILESIKQIEELEEKCGDLIDSPDKFNTLFKEKGWIAYGGMDLKMMQKAIEIAENENLENAETFLVEEYSKTIEKSLEYYYNYPEELNKRKELIELAFTDYKEERYYSCILLLFSILDGFVVDSKMTDGRGFFVENDDIYSWDSIAAHKSGLIELKNLFYKNRGTTNTDEIFIPYRNGIIHGRDLNYNNKIVATKLWAALFALKEGILEMKKNGKEPPEKKDPQSLKEIIDKYKQNEKNKKELEKEMKLFKPRKLFLNKDYNASENIEDYTLGTPEYALIEFFNFWKKNNYGNIAKMEWKPKNNEFELNKEAWTMKNEIFKNKELISFKLLSISDESYTITNINTELNIKYNEEDITRNIPFRLIYDSKNNEEPPLKHLNNGEWKIANYTAIKFIE